jgi:raffinose/stachyose/melibiose transport system substrate-binding protein
MRLARSRRSTWTLVAVAGSLALTSACSAGSLRSGGDSDSSGGKVTLSFLVDNGDATVKMSQQLAKDFAAANPNITVKVDTRPGGTDGDNLVKTRLSTGDMSDVFMYNSGSLFQAIKPQQNLVPLTSESWVGSLDPNFKTTVSAGSDVYGAPYGSFFAGAVLYNRRVYDKLGLQVPKTWDQFMQNNAAIKKAGIDPVIQTYGDTWTSQLFVLGDYHNIAAKDAQWAQKYTANQVKYATDGEAERRPQGAGRGQGRPLPDAHRDPAAAVRPGAGRKGGHRRLPDPRRRRLDQRADRLEPERVVHPQDH